MPNHLSWTDVDRFMNILSGLSPENLFMDGECSADVARRVERKLKADWKALEKEVGREVSESEIWESFLNRPRPRPMRSRVTYR